MTKVYLNREILNRKLLEKEFEIVADPREADFLVCWTRIPMGFENQLNKVIYIAYEPPLTGPVYWAYENFDKMHSVFAYNPDETKDNQFYMTENPIYYPVNPFFENDVERVGRKLTTRGVYYSGAKCKGMYTDVPNLSGINFKDGRDNMAQYFLDNYKNTTIIGAGWIKVTKSKNDIVSWRVTKMKDILESNADFHLCIENYLMPYLTSERFHDGIGSDRVMLYLGDPKIEEWIPKNCYVDLMPYYNSKTNSLDCSGVIKLIENMTQEEYDSIILNAREFRDKMNRDGFEKGRDRITNMIIDRIKGDEND
jgi:hypothetical protein